MGTYEEVTTLNKIIEKSKSLIEGEYRLNFNLQTKFDIEIIANETFSYEAQLATDFQNSKKPDHLYINHGEFIKENGVTHLIEELKKKKNSNRALLSLINQDDIVDSNDDPIPSLMVVQCSVEEGNKLYFTFYFRALEVSKFLKINLEEMRIIVNQIKEEFQDIDEVYLDIFAFRAYIDENINPLIKTKFEIIADTDTGSAELLILLNNPKKDFIPLLDTISKHNSTIVNSKPFELLLKLVTDSKFCKNLSDYITSPFSQKIIQTIIDKSKEIKRLRERDSHNPKLKTLYLDYQKHIGELINEIAKIN